jgi:uncharacterized membrane protein YgcG
MSGSADGRAAAAAPLFHKLDRVFPLSEIAAAARTAAGRDPSTSESSGGSGDRRRPRRDDADATERDDERRSERRDERRSERRHEPRRRHRAPPSATGTRRMAASTGPPPPARVDQLDVLSDEEGGGERGGETYVAEEFQLGRPGEFEGPFGTEHVAHPPRVAPLELPFAAPGWTYSRTTRFSAFVAAGDSAAPLLTLVDDRDQHVALQLHAGGGGAAGDAARDVGTLTDSLGNVLLRLHGRVAVVPVGGADGRRVPHANETQFVIVVANPWREPLLTVSMTGARVAPGAPGATLPHRQDHPEYQMPAYSLRTRSAGPPLQAHHVQQPARRHQYADRLDDDDAAYLQRIEDNNNASGPHDVPSYDRRGGMAFSPTLSAPPFAEDLHRRFERMSVAGGSSGGRDGGGGGGGGSSSMGTGALPGVQVFAGELDAPNRPVTVRPVLALESAVDAMRNTPIHDVLRNEMGDELAVVTHAPPGHAGPQVPTLSLMLHPGVDVTLVTAVLAARMWMVENV